MSLCLASLLKPLRPTTYFLILSATVASAQSFDPTLSESDKANLSSSASHVAERIREANLVDRKPSVLVIDFFRGSTGTSSKLGTMLADQFSASLAQSSIDFTVMSREMLKVYFTKELTTAEDLQSTEACLYLGRQLGATGVVIGSIYLENNQIAVRIHLEGFGPPKKSGDLFRSFDEFTRIGATEELKAMLFQRGPSYFHTPQDIPDEPGVLRGGADGASMPTCIYCPDPQYSDEARKAKIKGSL